MSYDLETIRAKLATRGEPCDVTDKSACPGWFVSTDGFEIMRCDDCWAGHPDKLTDDEAAMLPEAQKAKREETLAAYQSGSFAYLTMYEVRTREGLDGVFFGVSDANDYANELTARLGVKAWVKETP
jgi:hypothetical protein